MTSRERVLTALPHREPDRVPIALAYGRPEHALAFYGDDIGGQNGMIMSVVLWRMFLKPYLKRMIDAAKSLRPGIPVFYHSDGDVCNAILDLIDIGVTIWNLIQPECMDLFEGKRRFRRDRTL